jgi:hypothetical protein
MKKLLSLLGLSLLLSTGCDKEFLEKQPKTDLSADNFYQTEADAQLALNGAYHGLQRSGCYRLRLWMLDIVAGNSIVGAGGASDGLKPSNSPTSPPPLLTRACSTFGATTTRAFWP